MTLIESPKAGERFTTWTDWNGYLKVLDVLADRRVHVTYDRGSLEVFSPSKKHERSKKIIGALLECMMDELEIDYEGGGSTTFRRAALDRGLEPDECYWLDSAAEARSEDDDPESIPRPDLAVEVEVSRSALDRLGIYAALEVPEVWRWTPQEGGQLAVRVLRPDGAYQESSLSRLFPALSLSSFEEYVRRGLSAGQACATREFRVWVRESLI